MVVAGLLAALGMASAETKAVTEQTISVGGLEQPADILIDQWGVAHIFAASERDAFFLQGFNAARDRLFQIDLWRRRGLGQLAAVFGPAYLEQDKAARLFLYRGDMAVEWRRYGPDAQPAATRFVAGINAYIDWLVAHPDKLPYEFRTVGYWPAKWSPDDIVRIRSHGLTRNVKSEVARAKVACHASLATDELRMSLQPPWKTRVPAGLDPCLPDDVLKVFDLATQGVKVSRESLVGFYDDLPSLQKIARQEDDEIAEGSNNWVIAPRKSATGRAIMANDPHRAYVVPSLRYLVHLSTPTLNLIGAGEPFAPGVSIGHNGAIAFGLTIFNIDQEDLYVYRLNPERSDEYGYQNHWEPLRVIHETIQVRGAAPVPVDLQFTRHGPVVYLEKDKHRAFAVRTVWLEPGMSPYFDSMRIMRAKTFAQFREALTTWGAPTVNQVYADTQGNIGWVASGLAPKRPNWDGLMPVPGDGRYEWAGFWRQDQLPWAYNPAAGYLTNSNEMNLPDGYPYAERKLGFEWTNGSRHQRINEVLQALPKVSIEDTERLQNDIESIPARRLIALLRPLAGNDDKTRAALALLVHWDARVQAESAAAALEEVWFSRHLGRAYKAAVLPKSAADTFGAPDPAALLDALAQPQWRFGSDAQKKRDEVLLTSLRDAYEEMMQLQGTDARQWQWGKLQTTMMEHPLAGLVDDATRAKLNVGPLPRGGSPFTPNQSTYRTRDFRPTIGPSFRIIVDVGNWDNSKAINMPGQSGEPESPHYHDLTSMWSKGEYFPLRYTRASVEAATEAQLHLIPAAR
jgi:penicillin amidase